MARCANQISYRSMTDSQCTIDYILSLSGFPKDEACKILKKTL
jgi:hypothetical protein